ncbi:hypothetical protein FRX31_011280 [Thalictrum thalictroides]|uniref:Uncharacterized protein n=1 Tax=Thalictrum thalictroides TaxID=46969 RepID=A0A7J6WP23_THATH|nr:hypothetical protein FRX31_011280 [Thalictrum thalictroides]
MEGRAIESSSLVDVRRNWANLDTDCPLFAMKRTRWVHMFADENTFRALPSTQFMKAAAGESQLSLCFMHAILQITPWNPNSAMFSSQRKNQEANQQLSTENDKQIEESGVPHDLEIWS